MLIFGGKSGRNLLKGPYIHYVMSLGGGRRFWRFPPKATRVGKNVIGPEREVHQERGNPGDLRKAERGVGSPQPGDEGRAKPLQQHGVGQAHRPGLGEDE